MQPWFQLNTCHTLWITNQTKENNLTSKFFYFIKYMMLDSFLFLKMKSKDYTEMNEKYIYIKFIIKYFFTDFL